MLKFLKFVLDIAPRLVYNGGMTKQDSLALVHLACDHETDISAHFCYFLVGWMGNHHMQPMASAARSWLETYAPEKLADFDKNLLETNTSA